MTCHRDQSRSRKTINIMSEKLTGCYGMNRMKSFLIFQNCNNFSKYTLMFICIYNFVNSPWRFHHTSAIRNSVARVRFKYRIFSLSFYLISLVAYITSILF